VLKEKRPKIICIDELDKVPKQFQDKLLNFMESGHIKVDQMYEQYDFTIRVKVDVPDRVKFLPIATFCPLAGSVIFTPSDVVVAAKH
jgi:hypothetical protein